MSLTTSFTRRSCGTRPNCRRYATACHRDWSRGMAHTILQRNRMERFNNCYDGEFVDASNSTCYYFFLEISSDKQSFSDHGRSISMVELLQMYWPAKFLLGMIQNRRISSTPPNFGYWRDFPALRSPDLPSERTGDCVVLHCCFA